jgi:hypothetical protein
VIRSASSTFASLRSKCSNEDGREKLGLLCLEIRFGHDAFVLPTWQETVRERYRRWPGEWTFWVRSRNYPQLEAWYRRQWEELGVAG